MFTFTVTRSAGDDINVPITLEFTVGGTATYPTDYTVSGATSFSATNGSILIPAGQVSASFTANVVPDLVFEDNESIVLTPVAQPGVFVIGTGSWTATIENDDAPVVTSTLLLHFNGANGSKTMVDSSANNFAVTASGTAAISTVQSKFGGSSLRVTGASGSFIEVVDDAILEIEGQDFTIDFWIYKIGGSVAYSKGGLNGNNLISITGNNTYQFTLSSGLILSRPTATIPLNTWSHVALTRKNGLARQFLNGIETHSYSLAALLNVTGGLFIGANSFGSNPSGINAYIDEFRIVIGHADYVANFAVPSVPYAV